MGTMRFEIHPSVFPQGWTEYEDAYLSSFDGRVFETHVELEGHVLCCRRRVSESARLNVPWPVPGFGHPMLATATLCERDQPYLLPVELARGRIGQIRNQIAVWERAGMTIPQSIRAGLEKSQRLFTQSVSASDSAAACRLANEALEQALHVAKDLVVSYSEQRMAARRSRLPRLPASLGCGLGDQEPPSDWSPSFCKAFNAAIASCQWRDVEKTEGDYNWHLVDSQLEWCEQNRLMVVGGPLLDFSSEGLPAWLGEWAEDFVNLQSFVSDFVETAVSRYIGRVRTWEVASRVNTGGAHGLSEEDCITLLARVLRVAQQVDEEAVLYVGLVQPWGEYLARGGHRFTPLDFADALMRFGTGLAGINLEINVGYRNLGTPPRDLLDFSMLIDKWSALEVPLHVTLSFPGLRSTDESDNLQDTAEFDVETNLWGNGWTEQAQAEWVDQIVPLLFAKQSVVGIFWTHYSDSTAREFPRAGLIRDDGTPKPALTCFARHHSMWK
ncbi:MAG: glycoside hydrolase [Planctomycetes bacterium]|nr:glycoside hydrolase [Planctomycetota bacterium]